MERRGGGQINEVIAQITLYTHLSQRLVLVRSFELRCFATYGLPRTTSTPDFLIRLLYFRPLVTPVSNIRKFIQLTANL